MVGPGRGGQGEAEEETPVPGLENVKLLGKRDCTECYLIEIRESGGKI